ncbi:MAG: hypothetical protein Q8861_08785 [Bacteroidota bacterium]|nr:hypothetical protein [Bacteroidota bacterium]
MLAKITILIHYIDACGYLFCLEKNWNILILYPVLGKLKTMNARRIYMVNPKKVIPLHVYEAITGMFDANV